MTKILHILSQIPSQTGSGVFFENLIKQCDYFGYQQAAVIGLPRNMAGYPVNGIAQERIHEVLFETEHLPFRIPGMSDVMPYESTVFSTMDSTFLEFYQNSFKEAVSEAVSHFRPDVIISNHLWIATSAAAKAIADIDPKKDRPKLLAVCHGTDLRQMRQSPVMSSYVISGCKMADGILSLNKYQAEEIHKLYKIGVDRIHLIGTGYDSSVFYRGGHPKERAHEKTELVYAGKLARSKGLFELIKCMELLDTDAYRLTIAGMGSGSEAEDILCKVAESGADIRHMGHLPQVELAGLFRESDIFVLPSYYEGLPLVVIEALASGMKVVVNELGGLRDWLGDAINNSGRVFYVEMPPLLGMDTCAPEAVDGYTTALASAIRGCGALEEIEDGRSENGYAAIEERSWTNVFRRIEKVLK